MGGLLRFYLNHFKHAELGRILGLNNIFVHGTIGNIPLKWKPLFSGNCF